MTAPSAGLAAVVVGPVQFDRPVWLWLIPICWALTVWIGRRSLSGMGTSGRRVALVIRLVVILLLAGAMAEPQWRRESRAVAVTVVLDASRSIQPKDQRLAERYVEAARKANEDKDDELGVVTVGADAYVQSLPNRLNQRVERQFVGSDQGTNLAGGVRLAMAVRKPTAANRLVMITDGNETAGSLLSAAEAAKAAGIPIDVLPVRYSLSGEVIVDQLVAPTTARMGENVSLKVVIEATRAAKGRLSVLVNDEPVDLDPTSPSLSAGVELSKGSNVIPVPITVSRAGPQKFRAVFEPEGGGDTIAENNEALAVTFVSSQGRVLIVTEQSEAVEALVRALTEAKIATEVIAADQAPKSLTELNGYDAIVLANEPAFNFTQQQMEDLKQYVHETGGGLVMVGGPESFGAGGWIGSPLEDALPVKLDPPQKRQIPRGALVLVMHSIEMPDGVSYGKKTAQAAVDALSRLDLAGIIEFTGGSQSTWVHPLAEVGDGSAIRRSIGKLVFGDMPDYAPHLTAALAGLEQVEAGAKHVIMITDGDAGMPSQGLLQRYKKAKVTISTVGVYPHNASDLTKLQNIAQATGGRAYQVTTQAGLGNIVQIFIKEAQTVKRSLIWEGEPFVPAFTGGISETMRGLSAFPPLQGYVVTGEREGLAMVTLRGKESDPISAQWQYGLGRVMAFTSDASTKWQPAWVAWEGYRAFWEQHLRWIMRPSGSANLRVTTEKVGDETRVMVDALDPSGERLNFARFRGRVAMPGGGGQDVELQQVGPGRYEGRFSSKDAGAYVLSMRYAAPGAGGTVMEGSVQAAVSKPFADEFRALTDNTPLLTQVASMTGGKVLSGNPEADGLWRREGLTMPVATRPIWILLALLALGLFLVDVGVRRVRIDVPLIAASVAKLFRASRERGAQQMDTLRRAREAAKAQMARRADAGTMREAQEDARAALDEASRAAATASAGVKFEAPKDRAAKAGPVQVAGGAAPKPTAEPKAKPAAAPEQAESLSRLMKAKKRAQDEMKE
ncbi:MAG: VWA domain-containing protein [Phycisphaerae bacterium]|nr:VWA domain-containing protein [Phycisphaerae bacterium]